MFRFQKSQHQEDRQGGESSKKKEENASLELQDAPLRQDAPPSRGAPLEEDTPNQEDTPLAPEAQIVRDKELEDGKKEILSLKVKSWADSNPLLCHTQ